MKTMCLAILLLPRSSKSNRGHCFLNTIASQSFEQQRRFSKYICFPRLQQASTTNAVSMRLLPRASKSNGNEHVLIRFPPRASNAMSTDAFSILLLPRTSKRNKDMLLNMFASHSFNKQLKLLLFEYVCAPVL